jgi:hypothetical protein
MSPVTDPLEAEREAFNAAFLALELPWQWDRDTFRALVQDESDCVGRYVERHQPHLLKVYEKDFLRELILATKDRFATTA